MLRFAANLSMLFTEVALLQRFERAARAGFEGVEMQFPYDTPAVALRAQLQAHGLSMVLHNLPGGDWAAGDRGLACDPARVDEFRDSVALGISYATTLGVPQLNCLAGRVPPDVPAPLLRQTLVDNLRFAAAELKDAGLRLLVEPLNALDVPGFALCNTAQALAVLDEVGADNVYLQYDIYHAQRSEGELAATLSRHLSRIGHVQIADNPGRHEPGSGEINHDFLFGHLERIGYEGWIGCEYRPATTTEAGLGWLARARGLAAADLHQRLIA